MEAHEPSQSIEKTDNNLVNIKVPETTDERHSSGGNLPWKINSEERIVQKKSPDNRFNNLKKECINPECPKVVNDEYIDCPGFTLSFYRTAKNMNKAQDVCISCHEKALEKYEEMAIALLNNKPLVDVELPTMVELVEVIDSDEEEAHAHSILHHSDQKIEWSEETETQMEEILIELCGKIDFEKQLKWEQVKMEDTLRNLAQNQQSIEDAFILLEGKFRKMNSELDSFNKPKSIAIIDVTDPNVSTKFRTPDTAPITKQQSTKSISLSSAVPDEPKIESIRSEIVPQNQMFHAVKETSRVGMQVWAACKKHQEMIAPDGSKTYRVEFGDATIATVDGKSFALKTNNEKLEVGARVISQFQKTNPTTKAVLKRFMPSVVGEKMSDYNGFRYLVFSDYGQVQYCIANEIHEMSEASSNVWEDVHGNLKQFIRDYLQSSFQCQRALLNLRKNQQILTEHNGKWIKALVQEIDCSIVRMFFPEVNSSEWLYRGSKRFLPLFQQGQRVKTNTRRNNRSISYHTVHETETQASKVEDTLKNEKISNSVRSSTALSTSAQAQNKQEQQAQGCETEKTFNCDTIIRSDNENVCKTRHFTPRKEIQPKKYVIHECSPLCLPTQRSLTSFSPLTKPLLTFWERHVVRHKSKKSIQYKAPCGRRLRTMMEIRQYLLMTECSLNVDNFDFDVSIQVLVSYDIVDNRALLTHDISESKEGMKIPAINAVDGTRPPPLVYSASRIPTKNVSIVTDPEFLACCDCTDDCADKTKCACFQLTIQGYKIANGGEEICDDDVSYVWKRLLEPVLTGVYECNSSCTCSSRCINKVVQRPIQVKMQLYRTTDRGWGVQCCHDIPKGTFICIYAGQIYHGDEANKLGSEEGDEYFADLDLIETATLVKEGYESEEPGDSDSEDENVGIGHDDEFICSTKLVRWSEIVTRSARTEKNVKKADKASNLRSEMVNIVPKSEGNLQSKRAQSFRKYYGKNEKVYVMDAKQCGNIGRYFNHSCDPNMFVQSVFVDTQDLRFPWIGLFASRAVKAGEELTWDYNYEVGSVADKVLICTCGSKNCRGRFL